MAPEEQGLAGGLLNTSFQFGGALALAVTTAVINANTGGGGSPQAVLDGFHPALFVPVIVGVLGIVAIGTGLRSQRAHGRRDRRRSWPKPPRAADTEAEMGDGRRGTTLSASSSTGAGTLPSKRRTPPPSRTGTTWICNSSSRPAARYC